MKKIKSGKKPKISKKRYFFRTLVVLLAAWLCFELFIKEEPVVEEPLPVTISEEEIADFLPLWSEYLSSNISKKDVEQLSLSGSGEVPKRTANWLKKKGWNNAGRFFYIEERLKAIVKSVYLKEHSQKTIEILKTQLRTEKDKQVVDNIKNLIEMQSRNFNVENVSEEEMAVVERNLLHISNILEGKVKL